MRWKRAATIALVSGGLLSGALWPTSAGAQIGGPLPPPAPPPTTPAVAPAPAPAPAAASAPAATPAAFPPLPANAGGGRRVVYSNSAQRVWLVGDDGVAFDSWLVSGRRGVPRPGVYSVFSRSPVSSADGGSVTMQFMVRFAAGAAWPSASTRYRCVATARRFNRSNSSARIAAVDACARASAMQPRCGASPVSAHRWS